MFQVCFASLAMCNDKSVQGDGDGGVQVIENHMLTKSHPTVPDGAVDDYGIDLSKPILDQVGSLGVKYDEWVHKPSMRPTFRMFRFTLCETFAATTWWVVPLLWIPVVFVLTHLSIKMEMSRAVDSISDKGSLVVNNDTSISTFTFGNPHASFCTWFVIGLTIWSFFEYTLHRFLFHYKLNTTSDFLIRWHYALHGQHHKFPLDKGRLVFPPVAATIAACIVYFGFLCPCIPDMAHRLAAMAGFTVGYISYDMLHYYVHHGHPSRLYFRKLKESHMRHHYKDADHGFGISSKFWDTVFGSSHPDPSCPTSKKVKNLKQ